MSFALQPLSSPVGREVVGLDISAEIAPETAKALHAAWLEHGFLLFRGIGTSPEVQLRLSRCFGELEPHSIPVFRHPDYARQQDVGAGPLLATIRLVMLVALPAYAGMAAVAHPLVAVLLGDKWGGRCAAAADPCDRDEHDDAADPVCACHQCARRAWCGAEECDNGQRDHASGFPDRLTLGP